MPMIPIAPMAPMMSKTPKIRAGRLRVMTVLFFFGLAAVGLVFKTGTGTLCDLGYGAVSAICPLGALETALAGRTFPLRMLISLGIAVVIIAVLGRFFCAWVCPAPIFRGWILGNKKPAGDAVQTDSDEATDGRPPHGGQSPVVGGQWSVDGIDSRLNAVNHIEVASSEVISNEAISEVHPGHGKFSLDSRHYILGGALLSSAVFGFPVFCLVCPVGLVLATFIGFWRLFQYNEPSWMLLVFPAIFILEIVVCRKWCRKICPLGALMSLLGGLNPLFRPVVNLGVCRQASQKMDCALCKSACEENIDLHNREKSRPVTECTKCRECVDACPSGAISFPLFSKKHNP